MPVSYQHARLSNGLSIVAEVDMAAHTSAIGFFVRTGARDESPEVMGVSHFLEHMMFKGTATRTSDDVNRAFDEMGAKSNAYTSSEVTAFHAATLPERLDEAAEVLADMMRPALREVDFDTERGVILEEIAMYADDPVFELYETALEQYYGVNPLGHRVLGTPATIAAMTAPQMRSYFENRYSADNTVVALSGQVDFDKAVRHIEKLCGHWQATGTKRTYQGLDFAARTITRQSAKVQRGYRMLLAPGPSLSDPRRYAAFVMAQLLGGADNSLMHWALVETGIAEEAEAAFDPRDGVGDLRLFVAAPPDRLDEAWAIATKQVELLPGAISDDDVSRIVAKVATGVVIAGERPDGRMHRLGRQWAYGLPYISLEEELAIIERVTVADVRALLAAYPFAPATVATLLPEAA